MTPQDPQPPQNPSTPPNQGTPSQSQSQPPNQSDRNPGPPPSAGPMDATLPFQKIRLDPSGQNRPPVPASSSSEAGDATMSIPKVQGVPGPVPQPIRNQPAPNFPPGPPPPMPNQYGSGPVPPQPGMGRPMQPPPGMGNPNFPQPGIPNPNQPNNQWQPSGPPPGSFNPNMPNNQWQPSGPPPGTNQPTGVGAPGVPAQTKTKEPLNFSNIVAALRPEPAKAPPLEWVGLAVSVLLIICGFLPWINVSGGDSLSGIAGGVGDGWIVAGAGLVAAIMGFLGLSRDSISLAAGQALVGLIAFGFAIVNLTGLASDESAAFGLILTLIIAVIVIILGIYNAFDAFRKGAKY